MDYAEHFTEIFKALSDPTRFKLLVLLRDCNQVRECQGGALCVNALSHRLGVTQSAVSQHLRILRHAGLVRGERHGSFMHYSLDPEGYKKCMAGILTAFGEDQSG